MTSTVGLGVTKSSRGNHTVEKKCRLFSPLLLQPWPEYNLFYYEFRMSDSLVGGVCFRYKDNHYIFCLNSVFWCWTLDRIDYMSKVVVLFQMCLFIIG